jgi:hypothetical protein
VSISNYYVGPELTILTWVGNFIGPLLFRAEDAPRYTRAWAVVVSTSIAAGVACILYRLICIGHNRRRDNKGIEERFEHAFEDDLTDLKVCLYTLFGGRTP